ncbi:MAG: hypothetical protein P1U86_09985 [Verrucomicrobiales bacterium]|nr:hypothetical protein [Verrucomicrobiales bacterium]
MNIQVSPGIFSSGGELLSNAAFPEGNALFPLLILLGLSLIAVGAARAKNAASTSLNHFVILAICIITFTGFGILVFEGLFSVPDWKAAFATGKSLESDPGWTLAVFQAGLVAVALSVACRSMIDRIRLRGLIVFSILFSGIVFPVLAQWAWGGYFSKAASPGWLEVSRIGFYDFAGAGVIHIVGGAFALAGAMVVGVRRGRLLGDGRLRHLTGHQPVLISPGVSLALIGWCGLHLAFAGLAAVSGGKVIMMTLISAAASGLSAMTLYRMFYGATGFYTTLYAVIGGLVSASGCAPTLVPATAFMVGLGAGILVVLGTSLLEKLRIDDAGGAVPAHLICGFWGLAAVSLFGPDEMKGFEGFKTQLLGGIALGLSAFVIALVLFKLIDNSIGLKVSDEEQQLGSDFNELSLNAYPDFENPEDAR